MASDVGRVSATWSIGLSLVAAVSFFGLATWVGEGPMTAIAGGTVWVFLLAMIVSMPLVSGWVRRRTVEAGSGGRGRPSDRGPMALTLGLWLCTLPFVFLLLAPWLGWRAALLVAAALAAVTGTVCMVLCVTRREWPQGGRLGAGGQGAQWHQRDAVTTTSSGGTGQS